MEKFIKWQPCVRINSLRCLIECLTYNSGNLKISMSQCRTNFTLVFDGNILSYRCIDESYMLKTLNEQSFDGWSFYKVKNSKFLKWFKKESMSVYDDLNIQHYAIYSPDDCIDILSASAPKVVW